MHANRFWWAKYAKKKKKIDLGRDLDNLRRSNLEVFAVFFL